MTYNQTAIGFTIILSIILPINKNYNAVLTKFEGNIASLYILPLLVTRILMCNMIIVNYPQLGLQNYLVLRSFYVQKILLINRGFIYVS